MIAATSLLSALTAQCFAIETQIDVKLVVPQDNLTLSPDDRAESAQEQISILILRGRPKVGAVRYGSIRLLLNGESVSRDMTVNGVDGGYDCVVDSGRGSSLPLHSGENLIRQLSPSCFQQVPPESRANKLHCSYYGSLVAESDPRESRAEPNKKITH